MEKQIVHINTKLLPFGQAVIVIKGSIEIPEEIHKPEELPPVYGQLETTVPWNITMNFENDEFNIPRSTCCLL